MMYVIVAALLLTAPFLAKRYWISARANLESAHKAWERVEQHAHVLLEDRRLDSRVGDLVEFIVTHVGDGALTRKFLVTVLLRRGNRGAQGSEMTDALSSMNEGQGEQFSRLLVSALFYDSLRAPIAGAVLRRVIYWLAPTATDKTAPVNRHEVAPVLTAAGKLCHA